MISSRSNSENQNYGDHYEQGFVRAIYNDLYTVAKQKDVTMNFTPWTQPRDALRPGKGGNHRV